MGIQKPYRILHIMSSAGGGIASFVYKMSTHSNPDRIVNSVMAFNFKGGDKLLESVSGAGGSHIRMPRPKVIGYRGYFAFLDEVFSSNTFDAVHCHIDGFRSLVFKHYANKYGKRMFIHAHRTVIEKGGIMGGMEEHVNRYVSSFVSDLKFSCGEEAARFVFGKDDSSIIHLNNGVDVERYTTPLPEGKRESLRREFGIREGDLVLGHIGRLSPVKNQKLLMRLACGLRDRGLSFKMIVLGKGKLESELRRDIEENDLANQVILTGYRYDVESIYKMMDVFLLPSLAEAVPTVVMEAQASGVPCLVSDRVDRRCDLGLGLLDFLGIEDGLEAWEKAAMDIGRRSGVDRESISRVFSEKGYDIGHTAREYERSILELMEG